MRVFIAGMATETNSFSPLPTGAAAFAEGGMFRGDATRHPETYATGPLHVWRRLAQGRGWAVAEGLCAFAQPGGPTVRAVWEGLRDGVLADLHAAGSADIVLLALHGAMMADGCDDCEGALLAAIRAAAPGAVIGGLLDPHSHLTPLMLESAGLLVAFREYPHVDVPDRAADLFDLAARTASGQVRPVMRAAPCGMLVAMPTPLHPMRAYVDAMAARAGAPGVLSISLIHGFPWGDHPDAGSQALVIADGDAGLAAAVADDQAAALWTLRHALLPPLPGIDAALDLALAEPAGPVVLADQADNPGGGAPGDATFLLRRVLERGLTGVVSGIYWDPIAVRLCAEAGEGATLDLRLGGKLGPMSGDPLDLRITVRAVRDGLTQRFGTLPVPLGRMVWACVARPDGGPDGGVDLVLNDLRTQVLHPEAFTALGIDLGAARIVCVKSSTHWRAGFAPIAARLIDVATPGAISPVFDRIPARRQPPLWPRHQDPAPQDVRP